MWRDDLIQGWYVKTNRVDRTRYQKEKHTFDSTPTVGLLMYSWDGNFFFYMNTMIPLIYCWFSYNKLPVVSWSGWLHVKMEANYWIKQGVYCTYVMFDKSHTWSYSWLWASVSELYIYSPQVTENVNNHIPYVTSSQRSRTRLFCYVKCHMRFWPYWTLNLS